MSIPYWDNLVLAMPMDGIDGSTSFTDLKGKTITPYGNARLSTDQAKFDGVSAFFDGNGDYLQVASSTDFDFGTGLFTITGWFRLVALSGASAYPALIARSSGAGALTQWALNFNPLGNGFGLNVMQSNGTWLNCGPLYSGLLTTNVWHHFALVRQGTSATDIKLYLNGALVASSTSNPSFEVNNISKPLVVGGSAWDACSNCYIDDLCIIKGVALYTENFTPPTSSLLSNNVGTITPPLHSIEAAGVIPIVGVGVIVPAIESVAGDDGAIIASGEISPSLETITASGTSEAVPATNHAEVTPKLESISGSGYTSVVGFGSIVPKRRGTISGSGTSGEWIGNGTIAPRLESVTASGGTFIIGRAALEGKKGTVNGLGSSAIAGTGRVVGRVPFISGLGFMGVGGSAQIQTLKDVVSGSGTSYISGSAAIVPPKEKISASKYNPLSYDTLNFSRGSVVTGGAPAPLAEPLHFSRH